MAKSRNYRVVENEAETPDKLVMAGSQAQAIRHVVGERYEAIIATPHEVAKLVGAGVNLEIAGDDNAE